MGWSESGIQFCWSLLLIWPDCPNAGNGICLLPNLKASCRVPRLHSMAISTTEVCVQICFFCFSLVMTLWNCHQFAHNWGLPNSRQQTRYSQSQCCAVLNLTLLSSPETAPLISFICSSQCLLLLGCRQNVLSFLPPPVPSGNWWEKSNRTWKMQPFVSVAFSLPFWFLHRDLTFLIHF